ncbi:arylesterase [Vibrio breoganii]|uniref:arylesterase n=1 Tax=Vibrio breoganii TaxID=553239 RepID=UPI0002E2FED2|nr:arylesterase [Vibrio breoganii]OCH73939.1 arylesterase [Vibrio breoganii]OEF88197.1 arylesterase [Vibrio breoganii 1C10]PML21848.1 arylesterase [Vibrio breoganii]PML84151.1 arylesterase [Vibrio breoganii]PMM47925.1 arylesterase [Vibrio breoganii]
MIRVLSFVFLILSINANAASLLVLGDSLSAGYQMPIEKAWPTLLPDELSARGHQMRIINGSISGDTTGNGLTRLPALLDKHRPDYVLIELGANDGLRGFPPKLIKDNLTKLIDLSEESGAKVIVMQIQVPPNYGKRYTQSFEQVYPSVTEDKDVDLIPFFLAEIITDPDLMMQDGLHPKAHAQPWIAEFVALQLSPLL